MRIVVVAAIPLLVATVWLGARGVADVRCRASLIRAHGERHAGINRSRTLTLAAPLLAIEELEPQEGGELLRLGGLDFRLPAEFSGHARQVDGAWVISADAGQIAILPPLKLSEVADLNEPDHLAYELPACAGKALREYWMLFRQDWKAFQISVCSTQPLDEDLLRQMETSQLADYVVRAALKVGQSRTKAGCVILSAEGVTGLLWFDSLPDGTSHLMLVTPAERCYLLSIRGFDADRTLELARSLIATARETSSRVIPGDS